MTMRITGMSNSGIDIDALVTDTLKPYKLKIQAQEKQQQILEWKQEQYQSIMKKSNSFYNKYLDTTSSTSLYSLSAYNQSKFTSDNEAAVTATGSGNANIENYSVTVEQLAAKASGKITDATLTSMATNEANNEYTVSASISGQAINFQAKIGSVNEADNLNNFKNSIKDKISELDTAYTTETDSSKKKTIDDNIKTLYKNLGKDYVRAEDGSVTITDIADYTEDSLKSTINDISVATATTITASDGTNNVTSKLYVKLNGSADTSSTVSNYNKQAEATNIIAKYSTISGGIVFQARDTGDKTLTINGVDQTSTKGTDLKAIIKNSYGETLEVSGTINTKTVDGVTYNFKAKTTTPVTITGSQDVTELKTKIVNFMNDYNDLIGQVNGKLWEEYDSDYLPLTDDEKESMSNSQIEKWEAKAQKGLLRKDEDLKSLADNMKNVMSTLMKSTGIDLEGIGIKPVNDYKELNGTFTIDEDKLTKALQSNFEDIKDLFMKGYGDDVTSKSGIMPRLRSLMNDNFTKFDSVFNKKAASNGLYASTNEMTKQIIEKKNLIDQMNDALTDREDSLYSKYSKLETAMAEAQSQQSQMASWFTS